VEEDLRTGPVRGRRRPPPLRDLRRPAMRLRVPAQPAERTLHRPEPVPRMPDVRRNDDPRPPCTRPFPTPWRHWTGTPGNAFEQRDQAHGPCRQADRSRHVALAARFSAPGV